MKLLTNLVGWKLAYLISQPRMRIRQKLFGLKTWPQHVLHAQYTEREVHVKIHYPGFSYRKNLDNGFLPLLTLPVSIKNGHWKKNKNAPSIEISPHCASVDGVVLRIKLKEVWSWARPQLSHGNELTSPQTVTMNDVFNAPTKKGFSPRPQANSNWKEYQFKGLLSSGN